MDLAERVYRVTASFPPEEKFGLISQMRRAAVSVPSNIAEGCGRDTAADYARFLRVAAGSLWELETQIILAGRIKLAERKVLADLLDASEETSRMLHGLIRSKKAPTSGPNT
jgi:four helix bundle protein